jgi:hypothetical protein
VSVTRTIQIDDLTPQELAALFAGMSNRQQAEVFSEIWRIAKEWPGAGWCRQSCDIVDVLDKDGRDALETLAAHLLPEVAA